MLEEVSSGTHFNQQYSPKKVNHSLPVRFPPKIISKKGEIIMFEETISVSR
jgi:hypothetical protein